MADDWNTCPADDVGATPAARGREAARRRRGQEETVVRPVRLRGHLLLLLEHGLLRPPVPAAALEQAHADLRQRQPGTLGPPSETPRFRPNAFGQRPARRTR